MQRRGLSHFRGSARSESLTSIKRRLLPCKLFTSISHSAAPLDWTGCRPSGGGRPLGDASRQGLVSREGIRPFSGPAIAIKEVMTRVPVEHASPGIKAALAEIILKAAAQGVTSHDGLISAASSQVQAIISMMS